MQIEIFQYYQWLLPWYNKEIECSDSIKYCLKDVEKKEISSRERNLLSEIPFFEKLELGSDNKVQIWYYFFRFNI